MKTLGKILGITIIGMLLMLYLSFAWGFVSYKLFNWFIIPSFLDKGIFLPEFGILSFIGFSLFINTLIRSSSIHIKSEYKDETTERFSIFFNPWLILLLTWFIKLILF